MGFIDHHRLAMPLDDLLGLAPVDTGIPVQVVDVIIFFHAETAHFPAVWSPHEVLVASTPKAIASDHLCSLIWVGTFRFISRAIADIKVPTTSREKIKERSLTQNLIRSYSMILPQFSGVGAGHRASLKRCAKNARPSGVSTPFTTSVMGSGMDASMSASQSRQISSSSSAGLNDHPQCRHFLMIAPP